MHVIAGEARGRRLETLPGEEVTRPTTEKVKEAIFSSVQFNLPGAHVLDLFAGSGQLGIEAISRGAARCVFLDQNRDAVRVIMENCKHCNVFDRSRVSLGEASLYLSAAGEQFDLVLMDPPYRNNIIPPLLPAVDKVCAAGAIVLCETERDAELPAAAGNLTLKKKYQYGTIAVWRYEKEKSE